MSKSLYLAQVAVLGGALVLLIWRNLIMRVQVLGWMALTASIVLLYGVAGQQTFYSNDQVEHVEMVNTILNGFSSDSDWLIFGARLPYTLPAALLTLAGIETLLALKVVSLTALLILTSLVSRLVTATSIQTHFLFALLSSTMTVGVFFSSLGLRETTMMCLVFISFTADSPAIKATAVIGTFLLRPHLAVTVFAGLAITKLRRLKSDSGKMGPLATAAYIAIGSVSGQILYQIGLVAQRNAFSSLELSVVADGQIILRLASNLVGLQFLTVPENTVNYSIPWLLLLRLPLAETVLIPCAFTLLLALTQEKSKLSESVMWAFTMYVGIAASTDFNSFRQNIPFMPVMGLVVLLAWKEHRESRSEVQTPSLTARRET